MNTLQGKVVDIQSSQMISLITVEVKGDLFSSIVLEGKKVPLNYKKKDSVNVIFKETEVGIAKNLSGQISFRNRFKARIKQIDQGDLLSRLILDYNGFNIESVISTKSVREMKLKESEEIEWLVKTNEVSLMPIPK